MVIAAAREDKPTVAVILMFVAVFLFTLIDSSAKWLILDGLSAVQVIFARYCGAFFVVILLFIPRGGLSHFVSNNPKLQFSRAMALLGGTTFNFFALKFLPITTTIAIFFAMPLVITVLGYLILGEKVGLRRFAAVFVGFLGVLIIIQPWGEDFHWAMILSVAALFSASSYFILTRQLAGQDNNATRCLIPRFDGAIFSLEWKEALWDKYVTAAPRPRTPSEQQDSDPLADRVMRSMIPRSASYDRGVEPRTRHQCQNSRSGI